MLGRPWGVGWQASGSRVAAEAALAIGSARADGAATRTSCPAWG